jgi:hypothetical protein
MLLLNTLAVVILCGFALARADSSKCSAELQGILYEPLTYGKDYMTKVAAEFNRGKALLFTAQADSYIATFEQQWGVTVSIADPSNICTSTTEKVYIPISTTITRNLTDTITFSVDEEYTINNLVISVTGIGVNNLNYTVLRNSEDIEATLIDTNVCLGASFDTFNIGFEDGATDGFDCSNPNAGAFIDPWTPLSVFNGQSSGATWTLEFNPDENYVFTSITFYNVTSNTFNSCSRDVMKALTNIPGYRYDPNEQTVYFTEDVFDDNGNFKQVTISRPISGMIVKK